MKKYSFFVLFFVILFQRSFAQGFEVKPMKLYFDNTFNNSQIFTIKNLSNQKSTYLLQLQDFTKDEKGNLKLLPLNSTQNSCADFISFYPAMVEIDSMSEKTIQVKFEKNNLDSSLKWGMLIVKSIQEKDSLNKEKSSVLITPQIAVKIYCNNKFDLKPNFILSEIIENKNNFSLDIENKIDAFSRLNILILLTNIETLKEVKIDEISTEFLPLYKRNFEFSLPKNLEKGKYSIAFVVKDENLNFIEGKELIIEL